MPAPRDCTTTAAPRHPPISSKPPAPCPLLLTNALLSAHAERRRRALPAPFDPLQLPANPSHATTRLGPNPSARPGNRAGCPLLYHHTPARIRGQFLHSPLSHPSALYSTSHPSLRPHPGFVHTANLLPTSPLHLPLLSSLSVSLPACALATKMHPAPFHARCQLYCNTSSGPRGGPGEWWWRWAWNWMARRTAARLCRVGMQLTLSVLCSQFLLWFVATCAEHHPELELPVVCYRRKASAGRGDHLKRPPQAAGAAPVTSRSGRTQFPVYSTCCLTAVLTPTKQLSKDTAGGQPALGVLKRWRGLGLLVII